MLRWSASVVSADLALLMVLSLEKENITKKTDQSWQTISVRRDCCSTARVATCHWACPYVPRGNHVGADPDTTPRGGTSNSRRQTTGTSTSLHNLFLLPFLPDLLHSIL